MTKTQLFVCLAILFCIAPIRSWGRSIQLDDEHFGLATGFYERQQYDEAIDSFRLLIEQSPNSELAAMSYFFLAESYVQLGDFQSAYPAYEIFLARLPEDAYASRALFRLAEASLKMGWHDRAVEFFERFLSTEADQALTEHALTYLGELRLKRHEPQLALKVFESAINRYPNSVNSVRNRFGLARALQTLGREAEAVEFFRLLLESTDAVVSAKSSLQLGVIEFHSQDYRAAATYLDSATKGLEKTPFQAEALYWYAKNEMGQGDFKGAFKRFKQAQETVNNDDLKAAMLFDGSVAAAKSGFDTVALNWLDQLESSWPNSSWSDDALQLKIQLYFEQENYNESLKLIDKFQNEFDDHESASIVSDIKARVLYALNRFEDSIALLNELIAEREGQPIEKTQLNRWLYLKALSQIELEQYSDALSSLGAIEETTRDSQPPTDSVLLAKASCHVGLGQDQQSIKFFEEYLSVQPDGSVADKARTDLVIAYAKSDRWDDSMRTLDRFVVGENNRAKFLDTVLLIAETALGQKRFSIAEKYFEQLSQLSNPRHYVVRGISGLAWINFLKGDRELAVSFFSKIVEEYGETEFAAEAALACGKHFEQQKQYDVAAKMYQQVAAKFTDSQLVGLANIRAAYCMSQVGGLNRLTEAAGILENELGISNELQDEVHYHLAWVYSELGYASKSHSQFLAVTDNFPNSKYWNDAAYRVAEYLLSSGDFQQAKKVILRLRRVEDIESELASRILFLDGRLRIKDREWSLVTPLMDEILRQSDNEQLRQEAHYWLAESNFQSGEWNAAIKQFDKILESAKLQNPDHRAWSKLRVAQALLKLEKWTLAFDTAEDGVQKFGNATFAHEFYLVMGKVHSAMGRLTEARDAFEKVVSSASGKATETAAEAQWRIGETYFHQQKYERAIESFYRVDSLYSYRKWRAAALVEAGKCQEHLGNWNHAINLYQQTIKKYPGSDFCIAAEKRMKFATLEARKRVNEPIKK